MVESIPSQLFCHATLESESELSDICLEGTDVSLEDIDVSLEDTDVSLEDTDVSLEATNVRLYFVDLGGKDVGKFISV